MDAVDRRLPRAPPSPDIKLGLGNERVIGAGVAQTLDQVLDGSQDGNGGTRHHFVTDPTQRAKLEAFMRSIDDGTPIFP